MTARPQLKTFSVLCMLLPTNDGCSEVKLAAGENEWGSAVLSTCHPRGLTILTTGITPRVSSGLKPPGQARIRGGERQERIYKDLAQPLREEKSRKATP